MAAIAILTFFTSIIAATAITVRKSGINLVTLSESTSFNEFTSPITLAKIFPVGRLSKKLKLNFWICTYSSFRIVNKTWFDIFAIIYILSFTPIT